MNIIKGLPVSARKSAIMVVTDRLSKFSHLIIIIKHMFTAPIIAHIFFDEIFKLYGLPSPM